MSDPHVAKWRQRGEVFVWKNMHPRSREWNIMADDAACEALVELLDMMENARWPSTEMLSVVKPTVTPDGEYYRFRRAATLTLKHPKGIVPDDHWLLEERGRGIVLALGHMRLNELREAIVDMKGGGGDYAIGGDDGRLWIWWYIKQPARS